MVAPSSVPSNAVALFGEVGVLDGAKVARRTADGEPEEIADASDVTESS